MSTRSQVIRAKKLLVVRHAVDALLGELECSKENRVDYAGARHGNTKAWVKLVLNPRECGKVCSPRYIALPCPFLPRDSFAGRYSSLYLLEKSTKVVSTSRMTGGIQNHTHAQLTSPQSPPATTTASGCVGEVPRAFAKTCFTLSYVTK